MAIEAILFHVIRQHFEEGLFNKKLSYEQALEIARIVMSHAEPRNDANLEIGDKVLDDGKTIEGT